MPYGKKFPQMGNFSGWLGYPFFLTIWLPSPWLVSAFKSRPVAADPGECREKH